jgi:hypothetical protein
MLNDSPLEFHELKISDQAKVLAKLLEKFGGADLRSIHELAEHEKKPFSVFGSRHVRT